SVGPEQGEHLAPVDLEVDAADGRYVAVALAQVPDHDGGAVVHATSLGASPRERISRATAPMSSVQWTSTGGGPGPGGSSGGSSSAGRGVPRWRNGGPPLPGGRGTH